MQIKTYIAVSGIFILMLSMLLNALHTHHHVHEIVCVDSTSNSHQHHDDHSQHQHADDPQDCHYCYLFFHQLADQIPSNTIHIPAAINFQIKLSLGTPIVGTVIRKIFIKGLRAPPQYLLNFSYA